MNADDVQTRRDFALMVNATLEGVYGKAALTVPQLTMWFRALEDLSLEEVRRGLSGHVADVSAGQFPPKPADVRRAATGGAGAAAIAWGKVARASRLVGCYASVVFDDAAIHAAVVDLGGWTAICRTAESELPHLQRRFEASYSAHRQAGTRDVPGVLLGINDAGNISAGYLEAVRAPVLIGDVEKCAQVRALGHDGAPITRGLPRSRSKALSLAGELAKLDGVLRG